MITDTPSLYFSLPELLCLIGILQCVYLLVYMLFRAGRLSVAVVPILLFLTLGAAFTIEFSERFIGSYFDNFALWQWGVWTLVPPLTALLVIQVADTTRTVPLHNFLIFLLLPIAFGSAVGIADYAYEGCAPSAQTLCAPFLKGLWFGTAVIIAASYLMIWAYRKSIDALSSQKLSLERYWLIATIILVNGAFMGVILFSPYYEISGGTQTLIRLVIGLFLIYLANTSLFRIYPQAIPLKTFAQRQEELSGDDEALGKRIGELMEFDKLYQEQSFSRANLARELDVSETQISRVINVYFGKSFPQLLNEHRVEDAKRLLTQTKAPVKTISEEVGFNSLASFNRVFKDMTGMSPSLYRQKYTLKDTA